MYKKDNRYICSSYKSKKIKIGLPKGNIYSKSRIAVESFCKKTFPKDVLSVEYGNYIFYFLKHRDIPLLVDNNKLDFGITSQEWLYECDKDLVVYKELEWCNTSICLIAKNKKQKLMTCVTEYPNITKKYFERNQINKSLYYISGSCEALVPTIFDCCVGCVESGLTLKKNNLIILDKILDSKIVFVGKDSNRCFLPEDFIESIY